ncbi:curli production assembly/transport component CsgG [alpha proteobacterium U9-1i]|nr:curli production assembly/transport component CsgG [alpha proteobacterium U9-1i]
MSLLRHSIAAAALALTGGCASVVPNYDWVATNPVVAAPTESQRNLMALPPPAQRVSVAVYNFSDQTGQFRDSDGTQSLSRAVSQGGTSILVKALQDAGSRQWFQVVERERLENLLRERQIIREMRQRYLGETEIDPDVLPSLLFAGVLLEGGVIGYDTNTLTGGAGARYLGVGAATQYRQDTVTVYLRAVSVRTGEILTSVVARKTVASIAINANAFRFVSFRELLEAETGITTNEPDQVALQQAVERAVQSLVIEGAQLGYWNFQDQAAAQPYIDAYDRARHGELSSQLVSQ